jgi:predicted nucleic acid-binding protein
MTTPPERWLLDTNVWIFGLRREVAFSACAQLLDRVGSFSAVIPFQVLKELNLALSEDEIRAFYRLTNQYSEFIELSWDPVPVERVKFYEKRGCRKGDAVIAAHAEAQGVTIIVSENRQFLQTVKDLPVDILTAAEARARLPQLPT